MFSNFVVTYLFLGGTGGGALIALALLEMANAHRRMIAASVVLEPQWSKAASLSSPGRISRLFFLPDDVLWRGWVICACALLLGVLFLFLDLGRPERLTQLILHPQYTPLTAGAYALALGTLLASVFAFLSLSEQTSVGRLVFYALCALSMLMGGVIVSYTGLLLARVAAVVFWCTPLLPVLFALSSLSCGIGIVMMAGAFANTYQPFIRTLVRLGNADFAIIVAELGILAAWLIWGMCTPGAAASAGALLGGSLAVPFWALLVGAGLILPLFLEQYLHYGNYRTQALLIAGMVLFGGMVLRWCVVSAGSFDITQQLVNGAGLADGVLDPGMLG